MGFFKKLKERLFKSSSKIDEGLDAIIEDGSCEWYCNDNAMIDYFDRSHYTDINIGKWNKPYKLDIENMGSSMLPKVA